MDPGNTEESYRSRQVIEFLTVANEYCLFLEKAEDYDREILLDFISKISPLLYLKGALLPTVLVSDPGANERFVTQEQWEDMFLTLHRIFGKDDIFWIAIPESDGQYALIKASLAEHLSDIYQDMKDFVVLYQKNLQASGENAASEARRLFASHWGTRIAQFQRHVHTLIHGEPQEGNEDLNEILSGI
ncbi:MAG TPA: DUF5063 domain-containing protein [Bacteroidales bacterium]|nr:DUF5063 domain-containing protein [Bacteroidales bacterium]HRZ20204.1 DUF5063 domain-containing protein [Bacteroidales bacterium]HRZ20209.1 DUF5063 domain-containing protein [Bacteroidales bacterium]